MNPISIGKNRFMKYDLIIVGAGATGLYAAIDASARGLKVCLVDEGQPGKKTSSNSTKLMHGGVRYLKSLQFKFVYEGLVERHLMLQNAPDFVKPIEMICPCRSYFDWIFNFIGLKVYQWLAGKYSLGSTKLLTFKQLKEQAPHLNFEGVVGGVSFYDAKFVDEDLITAMCETFLRLGGDFIQKKAVDIQGNRVYFLNDESIEGKGIILALGPYTDPFLEKFGFSAQLCPSRGIHIVVDKSFHPYDYALFNMNSTDKRVFFIVPDQNKVLIGTTDVPSTSLEPTAEEIDFVIENTAILLKKAPSHEDILRITSGLRPLVKKQHGARDIEIVKVNDYTLSVFGGKWTSSRKTAETIVDRICDLCHLPKRPCVTKKLKIQKNTL
jgi:glycerol-3-phosphate dehydrogenase